jgi:hypothetical protein
MTAKADRAQELLDDPILQEAFSTVRERYRDLIEETPLSSKDDEALHDIRKMLHLLREVEKHLAQVVQDGHLEDFRVMEQNKGDLWPSKKH